MGRTNHSSHKRRLTLAKTTKLTIDELLARIVEQNDTVIRQNEDILTNQEEIITKLDNLSRDCGDGFNGFDR